MFKQFKDRQWLETLSLEIVKRKCGRIPGFNSRFAVVPVDLKCHSCCVSSWPQGPQSLPSAGGGNGQVNLSSDIQFTPNR